MFEGYFFRRRLKSILATILAVVIIFALFHRQEENQDDSNEQASDYITAHVKVPAPAPIKKSSGVMSIVEFTNSPYLEFETYPTDVIPIMVLSNASNIEVRDAIRRTWGFYRPYRNNTVRIKVFFIVGTDDFMTQRILMEQTVFDDVIQVTVPDMYTFSAYKELSAMIWVRSYLPKSPFYLKTEDDIILNMKLLVDQFLPILESVSEQEFIVGWFGSGHSIQRGSYQKFIDAIVPASTEQLHYAMSLLYGITASAADHMIDTLRHIELIEYPGDPFVTGILRDAAHIQLNNLATESTRFKYKLDNGECKVSFTNYHNLLICTTSLHFGPIKSMSEYFDAWNILIGETN